MIDEELPPQVADALRRMSSGPAPSPSADLDAFFSGGMRRGQRRVARLTTGGASLGVAAKVLLGTALAAASVGAVGAAHVLTNEPATRHRPPAVVSTAPRSEPRSGAAARPSPGTSRWSQTGSDPVGAPADGAPTAPGTTERDTSVPGGTGPGSTDGAAAPTPSGAAGTTAGPDDASAPSPAPPTDPASGAATPPRSSAVADGSGD